MLTIQGLVNANVRRSELDFKHKLNEWTLMEWGAACAGEVGEACNIAKKIKRIDMGLGYMNKSFEQDKGVLLEKLGDEIADNVHYACLWAATAGIDLEEVLRNKFNKVSKERGSSIRL